MACFKHYCILDFIQKAVITTYSLSALRAIQHPNWKRHQTVNKIVLLNHTLISSGTTITFLRTPAHNNIPGNETADQLAKISTLGSPTSTQSEIHQKQSTLPLSLPDMYALIKKSCFAVWNDKYTSSLKASHYKQIFQNIENDNCADYIENEKSWRTGNTRHWPSGWQQKHLCSKHPL